jgi:hypothetical protein
MKAGPDELFAAVRASDSARVYEILKECPDAATAQDRDGATALHYAAESGNREIVKALLDAGADINARDARFDATPTGWAIEYLRQRGGLLAIEIEDALRAVANGDSDLVQRYVSRFPTLRDAVGKSAHL